MSTNHSLAPIFAALLLLAPVDAPAQSPGPEEIDRSTEAGWRRSIARIEPSDAAGWRGAAEQDIDFIERTLLENSPIGAHPSARPIAENARRGFLAARERARAVKDRAGYYATMTALSASFGDPHAGVWFSRAWNIGPGVAGPVWPGFTVDADRRGVVVREVRDDDGSWRTGDVIEACDGRSMAELVALNLAPFSVPGRYDDEAVAIMAAPALFVDFDNPFIRRPQTCTRVRQGSRTEVGLRWRMLDPVDNSPPPRAETIVPAFSLSEPAEDVAWVRLPSFDGSPETTARIRALAATLSANQDRLRASRALVLDVRGNGGGSTLNADLIVQAIWRPEERTRFGPPLEPLEVAWRASADNLAYWETWVADRSGQGAAGQADVAWGSRVAAGLAGALERGEPLWVETFEAINPAVTVEPPEISLFPARVLVLSDGACASACLDFADRVLHLPGVTLVGADTSGDGLLMELRTVAAPSGMVWAAIPQKMYINRRRGFLERYRNRRPYEGPWTDREVIAWVSGLNFAD